MRKWLCFILFASLFGALSPARADDDVSWLLAQINSLRASHGLGQLTLNPQLMAAATGHSQYLANNPWTNPHVEANGSTPHSRAVAAGYGGNTGENVYGGGLATASIAFNWWIGSPVHYQSMTYPPFTEVGIGVASGPYGKFFTTDFGSGGGGIAPAPPPAQAVAQANSQQAAPITQPKPTRRPASPIPTVTPSITWTPSTTFTALPSRTPTSTTTAEPPTPTAIVLEVSPQPGVQVALILSPTARPVTPTVQATAAITTVSMKSVSTLAALPTSTPAPQPSRTSSSTSGSDPIRTLIPFALGLQVLILGGVMLRRNRR